MKIKDLINELSSLEQENDLFIDIDGKLIELESVRAGQFFKSNVLVARVEFDVIRAEQTLLSLLQFQPDKLEGVILERINRAIGRERVLKIKTSFEEHQVKLKEEQEKNADTIASIQESINRQDVYAQEEEEVKPKKNKRKKPVVDEITQAESVLLRFYSGNTSDGIEAVKHAKSVVGEERAKEIFKEVRNNE